MSAIVSWEYYTSLYDAVDETAFAKLESLAEKEVRTIIGTPRWNSIDPNHFYYDQLKDCICKMIGKLAGYEKSGVGEGIASVSNDGYSESYVVQTQAQKHAEIRSCVVEWLSGTGLVGAYRC